MPTTFSFLQLENPTHTPLIQAVERGNEEIVKMLLDKGAKPYTTVQDRTPLSVAKQKGDPRIISLLESHILS